MMATDSKSNEIIQSIDYKDPNYKIRETVKLCISKRYKILIEDISDAGDILFSVPLDDAGITNNSLEIYREEIFSNFIINFMGEMLIRENIDVFAYILSKIDPSLYITMVNGYAHKNFGMKISGDKLIFSFHMSLLQKIVTEDFRSQIV